MLGPSASLAESADEHLFHASANLGESVRIPDAFRAFSRAFFDEALASSRFLAYSCSSRSRIIPTGVEHHQWRGTRRGEKIGETHLLPRLLPTNTHIQELIEHVRLHQTRMYRTFTISRIDHYHSIRYGWSYEGVFRCECWIRTK